MYSKQLHLLVAQLYRFGAWDTAGVETVEVDEFGATCLAERFGTFALVAEMIVQPYPHTEPGWLEVTRLAGYTASCICLVIFILIIFLSAYLWEQFHILRLNLAAAVLLGSVASLLGELQPVQEVH